MPLAAGAERLILCLCRGLQAELSAKQAAVKLEAYANLTQPLLGLTMPRLAADLVAAGAPQAMLEDWVAVVRSDVVAFQKVCVCRWPRAPTALRPSCVLGQHNESAPTQSAVDGVCALPRLRWPAATLTPHCHHAFDPPCMFGQPSSRLPPFPQADGFLAALNVLNAALAAAVKQARAALAASRRAGGRNSSPAMAAEATALEQRLAALASSAKLHQQQGLPHTVILEPMEAMAVRFAEDLQQQLLPLLAEHASLLQKAWQATGQTEEWQLEAAQAAATRSCAHLGCPNLEQEGGLDAGEGAGGRRCSGCRAVWYCSTACQHADWKAGGHRRVCQALAVVQAQKHQNIA
jgi:hypothetical protein